MEARGLILGADRRASLVLIYLFRIALALAFVVASAELGARLLFPELGLNENHCVAARPGPGRVPYFRFRPSCHAVTRYYGSPYVIDTNEDGLRDRPRATFAAGAVVLLGDSHAEGVGLPAESTLGRQLERLGGQQLGAPVLNAGVRGSGPSAQLEILRDVRSKYRVRSVLWVLNENDATDERLVYEGEPPGLLHSLLVWTGYLNRELFHNRSAAMAWARAGIRGCLLHHPGETISEHELSERICSTVLSVSDVVGAETPVTVVAIPHGTPGENVAYFGGQPDRELFWHAMNDASAAHARVLKQGPLFASLAPHLQKDRQHLDAEGTRLWAAAILRDLPAPVSPAAPAAPRARSVPGRRTKSDAR